MRHWFIFLTVFQGNDKGTCVFILNFEHIDYILKVFNLIMWNLVFRLCCKSIQFFNLVSVFLKLKLCKFIVLLQLFVTSRIFLVTLSRNVFDSNVIASVNIYIIGLSCNVCRPEKLKKNEITGIF